MKNPKIVFKPYPIQYKAFEYLDDKKHSMVFFGGAARVSKSYLAVAWAVIRCLQYPGIHIGIGRARLTALKKTTILTMMEFFVHVKMKEGVHFHFNRMDNIITFNNGSKIIFLELMDTPSDPNFERIMSLSLTYAVVDEASQISYKAIEALYSRISYRLKDYNIMGKMLIVSNPTKGWLYDEFYKPFKDGLLEEHKAVILGTPLDNPTAGIEYVEAQMKILNKPNIERLLKGNWDYDDEDFSLFTYDNLINMFLTEIETDENYYLSCDIANIGKDRTVIITWKGLRIVKIEVYIKLITPEVVDRIRKAAKKYNITNKNIVIDADGLGVGVSDMFPGSFKFKANTSPFFKENFHNMKTQMIIKLSELVEGGLISIIDDVYKEDIIKELGAIKYDEVERDQVRLESKEKIKKYIQKSPDISDAIFMRMVFLYKKTNKVTIY